MNDMEFLRVKIPGGRVWGLLGAAGTERRLMDRRDGRAQRGGIFGRRGWG